METNFGKMKLDYTKDAGALQIVAAANIDATAKGGIKRLLSVAGKAKVNSIEALEGEAKIAGRINYKIVFLTRDDQIKNFEYVSDFTESLRDDGIMPAMMLIPKAEVIDIDTAVSGDEMRLQTVVDITLEALVSEEIDYLESITNALTKCSETDIQKLAGTVTDSFELDEEIETGTDVTSVLYYDAEICISSLKSGEGHFMISGEVAGTVTYSSDGVVCTKNFTLPYSERIDAVGAASGMEINAKAAVRDCRVILAGVEGNNIIRFETEINVKALLFVSGTEILINDICSPDYEVSADYKEFVYSRYNFPRFYQEKVSGTAGLSEDMDGIKRILFSQVARNNVANLVAQHNSFIVEGLLVASVIYEDENDDINSVQVELPYSLQFDCEGIRKGDRLNGTVSGGAVSSKVKRDREIEVFAELNVDVRVSSEVRGKYISDVMVGEAKECDLKAISVYICQKGETLWDIAKALKTPVEVIMAQNPSLSDIIEGGEKVIIYREIGGAV